MSDLPSYLPLLFVAIAVVFIYLSTRDYFRNERKVTIVGRTRLRMAFIFAAVGLFLYFLHGSFR